MDRSDEPKDDSFRLAKLMELLQYYVLSFYCGNDAPKSAVQEKMLSCGRRYGLINEGDDQILLLISLAAERVFKKLL